MTEGTPDNWWLQRDGKLYGPYSLATLAFILRDQRARAEDLAGPSPAGPWQPLGAVVAAIAPPPPLPVALPPPPPAPPTAAAAPRRRGSSLGWILAILVFLAGALAAPVVTLGPPYCQARAKATREAAVASLQQIGLALEIYAQDHDGLLPAAGQWEAGLKTILTAEGQLANPAGAAYVYNERLAGRPLAQVRRARGQELARDPAVYGGDSLVLDADGTVRATGQPR